MRSIFDLFGKSPFRPLADHTERVRETVVLIRPLFEAFLEGDWARTEEIYQTISRLEHKADVVKNDIRDHLPRSLFLPVDRGDLLLFLKQQDRLADTAEDLGVLLTMRQTPTPEAIKEGVMALVDAVLAAAEAWFETAGGLPSLQEASFTGPEVDRVLKRINEISDLEWEADKLQAAVSKEVFRREEEIGAVSVIFWADILRVLGAVANYAESTADHLRLMLAETMTVGTTVLIVALVVGIYMAWTIGANDVANAMGTSVGSGALTLMMAIVLAGVLEFAGAVMLGAGVTETISKGIVETARFAPTGSLGPQGPLVLAMGMLSALLGAAIWLHVATHMGLPVSTTHSIVGAVAGVGVVTFGLDGVDWGTLFQILLSWVVSPFLGGLLAYLCFIGIRRLILHSPDPVAATKRISPVMVGVVSALMVLSFIYKVLKNRMDAPPLVMALGSALAVGVVAGVFTAALVRNTAPRPGTGPYDYVERIFALLQIGTACFVAFAHGANDVANAVGPVAAVVTLAQSGFLVVTEAVEVPFWVLVLGGGGIVFGLATYGYRVIATIGSQITEVTPTRGFCAEFGAATTVLLASSLGLPVSTTHTLVGGVVGVGLAQGIAALNVTVIRNIIQSWLATVPLAAGMAALLFSLSRLVFL